MSAPHDPWKDILAGWCGNPWEPTRFGVAGSYGWCAHCGASQQVHDIGTIHAADAAEITTLRAQNADYVEQHGKVTRCLATRTVERDALRSTVDQQQARITALETDLMNQIDNSVALAHTVQRRAQQITALRQALAKVTLGMDRAGGDRDGMPECPWCRVGTSADPIEGYSHDAGCELVDARQALETP